MANIKKETKKTAEVVRKSKSDIIRDQDVPTIEKEIAELRKELFNLRFQGAVGKLENTAAIKKARKQIARMKTILTERANALK